MANLQIKGIDDNLYERLKAMAASENRSVSQQVLYLVKSYLAKGKKIDEKKTSAQILLELSGSWDDSRSSSDIIEEIRKGRKNSRKLEQGF
jgi:predicted CopG family antitoxin